MNISRRGFLKSSAAGVGLLATQARAHVRSSEPVDALIIGSGFGGAIAALRLARAGIRSVVLERGKRWPITSSQDTFCTFQKPDGRASWLSNIASGLDPVPVDVFTGVMEVITGNGMLLRNGAGVGGGSLVYNAIMLEPTRELFQRVFPRAIDYDELVQIYFPRVRRILNCSVMPDDVLNSSFYLSSRVNLKQAQNAGFTTRLNEINVDWDIVRGEMAGKYVPSAIDGQSWFGLNSGAKNSVDRNYLRLAERTGKTEVLPLHVVTDIEENRRHRFYTVTANRIDTNGVVQETGEFTARNVFVAAGSFGTSALLAKARAKGTLPRLSAQVGQRWGNNGDFIVFRGGLGDNNAGQGGPSGHFLMQDESSRSSPTNMVELVVPKSDAFPGASLYVGLGVPPALGSIGYDPTTGSPTLNWPSDPLDPRLRPWANSAQSLSDTLNTANPGSFNAFYGNNLSAHPVGGAAAGIVCDLHGRVKEHPGLYVVDGAFIPGGSTGGVNPSFTIAALAERSMENIIAYDFC